MKKKTLSIVVPVYNEEQNIPLLYAELQKVLESLSNYDYEIVFVNDGSRDHSQHAIDSLAKADPTVRAVEFSRNFGKEAATTAGIREAVGDAVICIDADLQHPPELLPTLVAKWEEGFDVVIGVRSSNQKEGFVKKYGSKLYYGLMSRISETEMLQGETDYRLLDRAVADVFGKLSERGRMTRSLINWLGFRRVVVPFHANARLHGTAQYSFVKLFRLAIVSISSNSLFPLRVAGYLGLIITGFSFLLGVAVFTERYVFRDGLSWHVSGSAQLSIINVFLIGVVLMALGIIALYIGRINEEVSHRPLYIIRRPREDVPTPMQRKSIRLVEVKKVKS
jgi:dolichol-phosphate mannosyltransferase